VVRDAEVRYAERAGSYLAYSIFGDGSRDLLISQARTPVDLMWELPQLASFMEALGGLARVIVFDPQGNGASDTIHDPRAATIEQATDDLEAVVDAAGCDRATLFDWSYGRTTVFAASHPERVRSIIIVNLRSTMPELGALSAAQRLKLAMRLRDPERLRIENPRAAHDPVLQRWWGRAARLETSPQRQAEFLGLAGRTSLDAVLRTVRLPTLVLHRRENRVWDIEASRADAELIPGARFVELPGAESDIFLGDTAPVLEEIARFLEEPHGTPIDDRPLATVLFTDIVSSTEHLAARGDSAWRHTLDQHERVVDRLVTAHRGRVIKSTGDGTLATFDGPARAVHCAAAILSAAAEQNIRLRAGVHTGEIEVRPSDIAGIAVHVANRIATLAAPEQILVSRTVVDLTQGSGLHFEPHGEHSLKGVPGSWPLFSATRDG